MGCQRTSLNVRCRSSALQKSPPPMGCQRTSLNVRCRSSAARRSSSVSSQRRRSRSRAMSSLIMPPGARVWDGHVGGSVCMSGLCGGRFRACGLRWLCQGGSGMGGASLYVCDLCGGGYGIGGSVSLVYAGGSGAGVMPCVGEVKPQACGMEDEARAEWRMRRVRNGG
eukprot:355252-Chlamydomonas_euryale.AAC.2